VRVSIGHSNAIAAEAQRAIAAGACSATHTFNAMRPLDHREPGILGVVLTTDTLCAELICDGIHVHPSLVKLWWAAKGGPGSPLPILITDGMAATGMPDGEYLLAGIPVEVAGGRASLKGDSIVLAGSVLTLDKALTNFIAWTGASVEHAIPLLTQNPAAMTGLSDSTGIIRVGAPANLLALDNSGSLQASIVNGEFQRPKQV